MDARGLVVVGREVDDRQGAGRPVVVQRLAAPRWGAPVTVGPCPAIAVPMVAVPPTPKQGVMEAAIATAAAPGMAAGSGRRMEIDPQIAPDIDPAIALDIALENGPDIALENGPAIAPVTGSVIAPQIDLESASVIAPVPSIGIRTTAQGPDGFAIGTIVTAIAVVPGMNGVSRPSAPVRATTRAVPLGRMQHRRLQRPLPPRTT